MNLRISRTASRLFVLAAVLATGVLFSVHATNAAPGDPIQDFDPDVLECLGGTMPNPGVAFGGGNVCSGETLTAAGTPGILTAIRLPAGYRLSLPFTYSNGWTYPVPPAGDIGTVTSEIDLQCEGVIDTFADVSAVGTPEQVVARSTAWESSVDASGLNESYLNAITPNSEDTDTVGPDPIPFERISRFRADIDTIWLANATPLNLVPPTVLNTQVLHPDWAPSDSVASVALLGGPSSSPSTQLLCLQGPQSSRSSAAGTVVTNPAAAGTYVRFTVFLSAADIYNNNQNVKIIPNCKLIGGGGGADADGDCLPAAGETAAGTNAALADTDGDGLLDGWEVAWGSNPLLTDADGDLRTDFEEIIGPAAFLTNPNVADTDGDLILDGGLQITATPPVISVDALGRNVVTATVKRESPFGPAGRDTCPNKANGAAEAAIPGVGNQTNTDNAAIGSDVTIGSGDGFGDACDNDDDNDAITDLAEPGNVFAVSVSPFGVCKQAAGAAAPLNPLKADTNNDSVVDGRQCVRGLDASLEIVATPLLTATEIQNLIGNCTSFGGCGTDNDGLNGPWETDRQTLNVAKGPSSGGGVDSDADNDGNAGDVDSDSDGDGAPDGIEVFVKNTSPISRDSDRDGICDTVEIYSLDGGTSVGLGDVTQVALSWNAISNVAGPLYIPNKDVNGDGKVALGDVTQIALRWNLLNSGCSRDLTP